MDALNASIGSPLEVPIISMPTPPPTPLNAGETYHSLCKTKKIKLDIIKALIEGREEGVQSQIINKNRSKYFAMMPN